MAARVRGRETVFRVAGLPPGVTEGEAASIIDQVCEKLGEEEFLCHSRVHSLGQDPYFSERHTEMVATVTFDKLPPQLAGESTSLVKEAAFRGEWVLMSLTFDIRFLGFTPLNEVDCPHNDIIDCIVVSGLASHAYGSWKSRNGHFMWLRDDSKWRMPNVRVMLYGYDTTLVKSESFQTIEHIGTELGGALSRIRRVSQAICKMSLSKEEDQRITASCIYGLIFFGVPNTGIRIEHWLPIVKGQPNEFLVRDLRPGSEYLLNLQRSFETQFTYPKSKILSVFETMRTKTAQLDEGRWQITGPHEILVEEASATKPMDNAPESISLYTMQMNQNHADLPKFAHRHDLNYMNLSMELEGFWQKAIDDVQLRFTDRTNHSEPEATDLSEPEPTDYSKPEPTKHSAVEPTEHYEPEPTEHSEPEVLDHSEPEATDYSKPELTEHSEPEVLDHSEPEATDYSKPELTEHSEPEVLDHSELKPTNHSEPAPTEHSEPEPTDHSEPEPDTKSSTLPPECEDNLDESGLRSRSDLFPEPTSLFQAPETSRHVEDINLPTSPDPVTHPSLHESLQEHASESDEDLPGTFSLQRSVVDGRDNVVRWFLNKGADVHSKDIFGSTLLHTAVQNGHISVVKLLLAHGADVNATDSKGLTLMHLVPAGRSDIISLLLAWGLEIDSKDGNGNSGLMLAVLQGQAERIRTFLTNGADVNAAEPIPRSITIEGDTKLPPILIAVHEGQTGSLKVLVEHEADLQPTFSKSGRSVLHCAAAKDMHEAIRCLILAKVDLEIQDQQGRTALHEVAVEGNEPHSNKSLQLLLDAGGNIEAEDRYGCTALHNAARKGASNSVQRLLDAGANIEARSGRRRTPLHYAAREGRLEAVQRLLDRGAAIYSKDHKGETALHIACHVRRESNLSVIKHLIDRGASILEQAWVDPVEDNPARRLPPHQAALYGFKEAVELFINSGFGKGSPDAHGLKMIHHAASNGHVDVLRLLLERGASSCVGARYDVDHPLHLAARRGHDQAVAVLCEFGANVNIRAIKDGCSSIHYAARHGHTNVISVLHRNRARINAIDNLGRNALHYALDMSQTSTVSLLCELGAWVNVPGRDVFMREAFMGNMVSPIFSRASLDMAAGLALAPLIHAVVKDDIEIVRILLKHGADVQVALDGDDWTPLHIAADHNLEEIVSLLLENGADRKAVTIDGETAWEIAKKNGHRGICKKLGKPRVKPRPDAGGKASDCANSKRVAASVKRTSKK